MSFTSVASIKTHILGKVYEYEQQYKEKGIAFIISFGTKKVELFINKVVEIERNTSLGPKTMYKNIPLMVLEANLYQKYDNTLFILLHFYKKDNYHIHNGKELLSEIVMEELFSFLIDYWMDYKKLKELNGVVFDCRTRITDHKKFFSAIYKEKEFKLYPNLLNIFGFQESRMVQAYGEINEAAEKKYETYYMIQQEIETIIKENPTLSIESTIKGSQKEPFILQNTVYFYLNEKFRLIHANENLVIEGETVEQKAYPLGSNSVPLILKDIEEQKRLENLFHPPVRNIKNVINNLLNFSFNTKKHESIIQDMDGILGIGETEKEMYHVGEQLTWWETTHYDKYAQSTKEIVRDIQTDAFSLFRVKTENYYWFILIGRRDYWIETNSTMDIPKGIQENMNTLILQWF